MPDLEQTTNPAIDATAATEDVDAILAEMAALADQAESNATEDPAWSTQQVDAALDRVDEHLVELETLLAEEEPEPSADPVPPSPDESGIADHGPRVVEDVQESEIPATPEPPAARSKRIAGRIRQIPPMIAAACVELILLLDLPFAILSPMIKTICGYIAIATLLIASAAWILGPRLVQS